MENKATMKTYFTLKDPYGNCWFKDAQNGESKYFLDGEED